MKPRSAIVEELSGNKSLAWLLLISYFLVLIYFHDAATVAADWMKNRLTLRYYNIILFSGGLMLLLILTLHLGGLIRKHRERRKLFPWFLLNIVLMIVAIPALMVVNMEAIHYVQYAILAILFFFPTRRYEDAYTGAVVLGVFDEIFQYLVLYPDFKYFDFNDIVLNMLGASAGLLFLAISVSPSVKEPAVWYRSSSIIFILVILLAGAFFSLGQPASFFPAEEGSQPVRWFSLYRNQPGPEFWVHVYGNRYYHVLYPWEGIGIMCLLIIANICVARSVFRKD